ncbi:hypothetical protein HYN48_07870 [Flavobacterium magnum]|uniref:DUF4252 domain-containing protein n=1 Tax=Flavobacterium magnum TaxID=2162713 RepID=A0A2S0REP9_9FLAO|nr:hypothetical protein [Flavobacterium magnum]AWA29999.1 hypothetical protein HYN48_07870 [Flavobacterium magnum]
MKKILALLLFITVSTGFSQTLDGLKAQTQKMYKSSIDMNFDAIMDLTYPKVFDIVDRETLSGMMKGMFDNEQMAITLSDMKPVFTYTDVKEIDGKKFSVIKYRNGMKMTLKGDVTDGMVSTMEQGLKSAPQFDKVNYDKATKTFTLEGPAVMIGVADDTTKNEWTFVNYDNEQLFNMIFDEKIKTALGL